MLVPTSSEAEKPNAAPRTVITDFGLALSDEQTRLTRSDELVGTPAYMAPEQSDPGEITAAADIYALGLIMYEMLAGCAPFGVGADAAGDRAAAQGRSATTAARSAAGRGSRLGGHHPSLPRTRARRPISARAGCRRLAAGRTATAEADEGEALGPRWQRRRYTDQRLSRATRSTDERVVPDGHGAERVRDLPAARIGPDLRSAARTMPTCASSTSLRRVCTRGCTSTRPARSPSKISTAERHLRQGRAHRARKSRRPLQPGEAITIGFTHLMVQRRRPRPSLRRLRSHGGVRGAAGRRL